MSPNQVINACVGNNVTIVNGDAFPVSFSHLLDTSTLSSDMFQVTLSNGDIIKPDCVNMFPAGEPGEVQTVTFLGGPFGNGREGTIYPIKVEVVGDLKFFPSIGMDGLGSGEVFSGKGISLSNYQGMDYQTASIHSISAEIREYDKMYICISQSEYHTQN